MEKELISILSEYGIFGAILGVIMWNNLKLQNKIFKLIENCTAAITNSTEATKNNTDTMKELKTLIHAEIISLEKDSGT